MRLTLILALLAIFPSVAGAQPLAVAEVGAPAAWCLYSPACTITVTDLLSEFTLPNTSGEGVFKSRTAQPGSSGMPAEGQYLYGYRIELDDMTSTSPFTPCVTSIALDFGPITPLDYDGDGTLEDVAVVTSGAILGIGVTAEKSFNELTLTFNDWLCPGVGGDVGDRSALILVTSPFPYEVRDASLIPSATSIQQIPSRVPNYVTTTFSVFQRGDCNDDGGFDIADPVGLLSQLFSGSSGAPCPDACDANDDGTLDIADAVAMLNALFGSFTFLPPPSGLCGIDPTADAVTCSGSCP